MLVPEPAVAASVRVNGALLFGGITTTGPVVAVLPAPVVALASALPSGEVRETSKESVWWARPSTFLITSMDEVWTPKAIPDWAPVIHRSAKVVGASADTRIERDLSAKLLGKPSPVQLTVVVPRPVVLDGWQPFVVLVERASIWLSGLSEVHRSDSPAAATLSSVSVATNAKEVTAAPVESFRLMPVSVTSRPLVPATPPWL
jgi:hypothetical protein